MCSHLLELVIPLYGMHGRNTTISEFVPHGCSLKYGMIKDKTIHFIFTSKGLPHRGHVAVHHDYAAAKNMPTGTTSIRSREECPATSVSSVR